MRNIVVIGGGASGMMAALTAAEDKNNRVILLERQQRVGKKLLSTGNGRCNLTNTGAGAENYHGENAEFVRPALEKFTPRDTVDFFASLGLITVEEYGGRVYPYSNSANSVVDVLRFALGAAGVELKAPCIAREVRRSGDKYTVITDGENFTADKLIIACGGAAGVKVGGVKDGYELLKMLGHKSTRIYPALVQMITDADVPRSLKGVRSNAALRLMSGGELLGESRGEVQFTDNGVSGPAVFDLSRLAAMNGDGLKLHIDLLPCTEAEFLEILRQRREKMPSLESGELLTGMLHNRLGKTVLRLCGVNMSLPVSALDDDTLARIAGKCADLVLTVHGTEGFENAQVTAGGVKTGGFDPETLESWYMPGLFACGEVLDVDGDCGGYNLQWAWASGHLAGKLGITDGE